MSLRLEGFNLLEIICEILYATHHMIHKKKSTGKTKQKGETNSCYKPAFAYNPYFNIYITWVLSSPNCTLALPASWRFSHQKMHSGDFPGGPVVKNLPFNAGDTDSIPGQETKIPHALEQLSPCPITTEAGHSKEDPPCLNQDPMQ